MKQPARKTRSSKARAVVLITPPFTQLSSTYAATPFLAGTLTAHGHDVRQYDLSLETALRLFSRDGLTRLFNVADAKTRKALRDVFDHRDGYIDTIDDVICFLQGKNQPFARRIVTRDLLPEGRRFASLPTDFSALELTDAATHIASLYIDDIHDIARAIIPEFGLSRYQEHLTRGASYDDILRAVRRSDCIDGLLNDALAAIDLSGVTLVGITVPFPGNFVGALKIGRWIKKHHPGVRIAIGGGFINTELRSLAEPRLFDIVDHVTLDDGAAPLLALAARAAGETAPLTRTFVRENGSVRFHVGNAATIPPATPNYDGIPLDRYITLIESENPMHRIWSERGYAKLIAAHGCYWHRCTFCDTSLDHIARYAPRTGSALADDAARIAAKTGMRAFHFVDEAMPAAVMRSFSQALHERHLTATWWGNVRFDRSWTPAVCRAVKAGGCIGVTGGLEGVTDPVLSRMNKGTPLGDMVRTLQAFSDAGILTHAYLMYGFPGSTVQDTVDALEIVRQLFAHGLLHSAYWHRFSLTAHSDVFRHHSRFGITPIPKQSFTNNDIDYDGSDTLAWMGDGLSAAVYNYMHAAALDRPVGTWFPKRVGAPRIGRTFIARLIAKHTGKQKKDPA